MEIFKEFSIEAAHYLPNLPVGHKCRRLHGHSFRIGVYVSGDCDPKSGWVMDFADITEKFQPLFERLDHYCLNEVQGLENPTSENLARWVWTRLAPEIPGLTQIVIRETCSAGCVYRGEAAPSHIYKAPHQEALMTQLAGRRCKPCEGGTPRLSAAEAQALLRDTPGWRLDEPGGTISKVYPFRNYYETMAFVNAVAFVAHREDHHPVMIIGYRQCEVRYTTHAISGLSENDFICAAKVDRLFGTASEDTEPSQRP